MSIKFLPETLGLAWEREWRDNDWELDIREGLLSTAFRTVFACTRSTQPTHEWEGVQELSPLTEEFLTITGSGEEI